MLSSLLPGSLPPGHSEAAHYTQEPEQQQKRVPAKPTEMMY